MRILVALLFLCSVARGQFLSPGLDWSAVPVPPAWNPERIPGMAFRWVSSDLPTNNTKQSDWIDRIQSNYLHQATSGNQSTNDPTVGLRFTGSQFYNVTNVVIVDHQDSYFMVVANDAPSTTDGGSTLFGGTLNIQRVYFNDASAIQWANSADGPQCLMRTNMLADYVAASAASTSHFYTNGIAVADETSDWGTITGEFMGKRHDGANAFHGSIVELCIWTNVFLTPGQVTLLHTYATNTYPSIAP